MTVAEGQMVLDLRAALAERDAARAAGLLSRINVAVAARDGDVRVVRSGAEEVLPVFLSMASWDAFRSDDEPRLLSPSELDAVLASVGVATVLFDPALPSAIAVPV